MSSYGIQTPAKGRQPAPPPAPRKPRRKKKSKLPLLPGTVDPTTGRVGQLDDPFKDKKAPSRRHREILRRQRLLRQAGFNIVVDGSWGPRSQKAWNRYVRNRSVVFKGNRNDPLDLTDPRSAPEVAKNSPEEAKARRAEQRRLVELAVKKRIEERRAVILQRAAELRANPQAGVKLTVREITEVLTDREVDYHPERNRNLTKALQLKLAAKGYKLSVSGNFDGATVRALKRAEADTRASELRQQAQFVIDRLYKTGMVKPGEQPAWSTYKIPTPEALVALIQGGGFQAQVLFGQLLRQALSPAAGWRAVQAKNLARVASTLSQGPASQTYRLTGDPEAVPLWQYLVDIIGVQDFVPQGDYSVEAGISEEWRAKLLQARAKSGSVREENAQRRYGTVGQAMALLGATGPDDFQRKMAVLARKQEGEFKQYQLAIASSQPSFWGDAIDTVLLPGEWVRTALFLNVQQHNEAFPEEKGFGESWKRAEDRVDNLDTLTRFAFELTVDPLNLVAPARWASTGAALSLRAFQRGETLGRYVVEGKGLQKALVYQKGVWSKFDLGKTLVHSDDPFGIADSRLAEKMEEVTRRLAQTKDEAMSAVSLRLKSAHRLGWSKPGFVVAGREFSTPEIGSGEASEWLTRTEREMSGMLREGKVYQRLLNSLKARNGSLYADHLRGTKSQYGASLAAYLAETFRPLLVAQIALRTAESSYQEKLVAHAAAGLPEAEMRAAVRVAQTEAQQEYTKILRGFGTWRAGGADPALKDWGGKNLQELLETRVATLNSQVESILLPSLQHELERHADELLEQAKSQHRLASETVRTSAKPVTHGGEVDFLRYAEKGKPGYSFVTVKADRAAVYRSEDGLVRGHALVGSNGSVRVFVDEGYRRQGIATKLYQTLDANGVPIENLSGRGEITTEGAEFFAGRRAKMAGLTEHPMWNADGKWRGAGGADDGDLVRTIRGTFENPIKVTNHRFGLSHTRGQMIDIVTRDLARHIGRLDDFSARRLAAGIGTDEDRIAGAAAHGAEEQRLIEEITGAWRQGDDGMWYDQRPTLEESRLYARHLGAYDKALAFDPVTGEVDALAVLGRAVAPSDLDPLENDLFEIGATMAGVWEKELAGSGFKIPGLNPTRGSFAQQREIIERRAVALRLAEEAALPGLLREQMALWRAFQYAQSRQMQLAYKGLSAQLALWKFATLALRPAWAVRNLIDNVAKGLIAGVRDPRYYVAGAFKGGEGATDGVVKGLQSVLEQDIGQLRQMIAFLDDLFGTRVGQHFETILNSMWGHASDTLSRVFKMLNLEVPPEVFEQGLRNDVWDRSHFSFINVPDEDRLVELGVDPKLVRDTATKAPGFATRFRDGMWNVMGQLPENYMRRVIYRHEYDKALGELAGGQLNTVQVHLAATERALAKVEETLFDYSKISVAEDNVKVFFPFVQFWRKNSVFWIESFATKPWLTNAVLHFDDDRREAHADLPLWMERYFHTDEIADALAVVPGLAEAFEFLGLGDGAQFDPVSMTSLAPFYRAFKTVAYGENQLLPADRPARVAVLGAIIDSLNDWGLGMNPLFRKPLEGAGVANYRAWQRVFPQTALFEAIANASGAEGVANLVGSLEKVIEFKLPTTKSSNEIADNFDFYVQTVVAEQVVRGEEPDIAAAERVVRDWFLIQNLWGYFGGIYWRRATPEDMYLAKLQDDVLNGHIDYDSLTSREKQYLRVWGMRGMDRMTYDRYVGLMPVIEAYFRGDFDTKEEIRKKNPEIIRWVDGAYTGQPVSQKFIRHAHRYVDQELFFDMVEIVDTLDVAPELKQAAYDLFLSPELEEYWKKNATPSRIRDRMIQAEVRSYFNGLNKAYFSIPETDFEARDAFLADHPELERDWGKNNDPSDDYGAILGNAKATLRDVYFSVVEAGGGDDAGFAAGADFLKQFSFMFEGTSSEKKIKDGEWVPGGGKWSAARISDYREAKPQLTWFFDSFLPKVGQEKGFAWLDSSDTDQAKTIRAYLKKYPSTKRLAYLKAQPWLKVYFGLPAEKRGEWLRGGSEGAKIVLAFFEKYGDQQSKHATDFLATRGDLNYYFSLPKSTRSEWLESDDPRAVAVKDYFKKYGKHHQFERAFKKLVERYPDLAKGTPEQVRRLGFWRQYFSLTPDQRPLFVVQHAESHGVFVYGEFGEEQMHDQEQEYLRRAVGLGLSERQAAYLFVKPLLEFYRKLPKGQKPLFVKANPELGWYFDNYSTSSVSGDKKLDGLLDGYFTLPADSFARSQYLRRHPEVQDWFDKRSSPAEASMRNLLEQYFGLDGFSRQDFLLDHPEIQTFFDRRRDEKRTESEALRAFDRADPRLAPFYENAEDLLRAAERMRAKLRQSYLNRLTPDGIETRRERRPAA